MCDADATERPEANLATLESCARALKAVDFELAYLAFLTQEGVKPLSRWERPLDGEQIAALEGMGLLTARIERTVRSGKHIVEVVLSRSPGCIRTYEAAFARTPIDKSAVTQRLEGYLFGYPPCCVEEYIRRPYAANSLPPEDQKILFHWACNGCRITALLLPAYIRAHDIVSRW